MNSNPCPNHMEGCKNKHGTIISFINQALKNVVDLVMSLIQWRKIYNEP